MNKLLETQSLKRNNKMSKLIYIAYLFIISFLFVIFVGLTIASFLSTVTISMQPGNSEMVNFVTDNVLINIIGLLLALGIFVFVEKYGQNIIEKINLKVLFFVVSCFVTVLSMVWVFSVNAPPIADASMLVNSAADAVSGTYTSFLNNYYFMRFPYQLTYVALLEIMTRVIGAGNYGALAVVNIISLVALYGAITLITDLIFKSKKITFYCIVMLGLCIQMIFFTTFLYGNILGIAAAMWAVYFIIKFFNTSKHKFAILTCLMLVLAVVAKPNNLIIVVAICIVLALHILQTKKFMSFIYIILFIIVPVFSTNAIIDMYSTRTGVDFGEGTPKTAWIAMGLQESPPRGPGWWNGYTSNIMTDNDFDTDAAKAQTIEDINERLQYFHENPRYAVGFFVRKALSQWNEPEFQSIGVSEVIWRNRGHSVPDSVERIYEGRVRDVLHGYMNQQVQVVYFGSSIGLLFGILYLIKSKNNVESSGNFREAFTLLPLIILGAFIYHVLFEAKSNYALVYLPLLIPYCAYGLTKLTEKINAINKFSIRN